MVKFQSDSTVGLRVMLDSINLDGRHNYSRIQISLFNLILDYSIIQGSKAKTLSTS